jgi:branched-chain amino acid transport system permease protein
VFIGPYVNGGIEGWIAYVVALGFLLVRPNGMFGTRPAERV